MGRCRTRPPQQLTRAERRLSVGLEIDPSEELGGERDNCTTWVYAGGKLVAEIADFRCDKSACTATRYQTETCF